MGWYSLFFIFFSLKILSRILFPLSFIFSLDYSLLALSSLSSLSPSLLSFLPLVFVITSKVQSSIQTFAQTNLHTALYVSIRQNTSWRSDLRQLHVNASIGTYVSIRQHTLGVINLSLKKKPLPSHWSWCWADCQSQKCVKHLEHCQSTPDAEHMFHDTLLFSSCWVTLTTLEVM